jgi:hypothetical protein
MPRPRPVTTERICSECDLDWELHPENPTLSDCVRLLKSYPHPVCTLPHYPAICWRPHYPPTQIWWSGTGGGTSAPQLPYPNYTINT